METTRFKGIPVVLGEKTYVVPPLSFKSLQQMQSRLQNFSGGIDPDSVALVQDAALAALKRNYPDMTAEDLSELLDVGNMQEVMEAVMDVSGLKRKASESGEAGPSTGTASTPS